MSRDERIEGAREALREAARKAQQNAWAPYSKFHVGAAVLTGSGSIHVGCNMENASYGGTVCAERNALAAAIVAGEREILAVSVATDTEVPSTPCGFCRQVMREFGRSMVIDCYGRDDSHRRFVLEELLPESFGPENLDP